MNDYYFRLSPLLSGIPNLGHLFSFFQHKIEFKKMYVCVFGNTPTLKGQKSWFSKF